ncbi:MULTISPECIES: hypothetical protein [unclassified Nonomuraea]|uniref:hypothetical protein n=1 Tax=unclassified Nonomuraea TaxID=2593643 RepID=UPI0035BFD9C0
MHEFTASTAGFARSYAVQAGVKGFDETFSTQGGQLSVGRLDMSQSAVPPPDGFPRIPEIYVAVVWEGQRSSLYTRLYNTGTAQAVALIEALEITEHADGLSVAPRPGTGGAYNAQAVALKEVPSVGLLEIALLTKEMSRRVPPWAGTRTAAGAELFRDTLSDGKPYYVLVTDSAMATVIPDPDGKNVAGLAEGLDRLTLRAPG